MEWNDIDFDGCSMYIGKSVKKIDNNTYEIKYATKNGKTRTIPIPPNVMEELKATPHRDCASDFEHNFLSD